MSADFDIKLRSDHRDLDPRLADARGIAARQRAVGERQDRPMPGVAQSAWAQVPSHRDRAGPQTYYDQPVVKAPPWGGKVSAYIVLGGVAGTSAALGAAAQAVGGPQLRPLVRVTQPIAFATGAAGAALLAADLGRPARALHMVRVFKPTSVMNVGGLLLMTTTASAALATLLGDRPGPLGRTGRAAGLGAGIVGIPLSGYTGVLLGATALPGWNVGITTLPVLFTASGAATTASALRLVPLNSPARRAVGVYAVAAQAAELAAGAAHDRRLSSRPRTRAAYGRCRRWRAGHLLTAASLALGALPGCRRRAPRLVAAALLGIAGSVATKTAVFDAGMATAADPLAVTETR